MDSPSLGSRPYIPGYSQSCVIETLEKIKYDRILNSYGGDLASTRVAKPEVHAEDVAGLVKLAAKL